MNQNTNQQGDNNMGNKYEISVWMTNDSNINENTEYHYESVWRGESRAEALKKLDEYAEDWGCVRLEYRK